MNPEQRRKYNADNDTSWDFNHRQWLREAFGPVSQRQDSDAGFIRERQREMNRQRKQDHAMAEAWTDFVFQNVLGLGSGVPLGLMGKGLGAVATRAVAARGAGPLAQRAAGLAGTVVPPYAAQKVGQKTADAINRSLMGKDKWEASQQRIAQGRTAIQQRNPGLEPFMEVLTGLPTGTPVNPFAPGQFLSRTGDMLVEGGVGGAMSLIDQAVEGQPLDLRQARQSFITNMLGAGDTKVIRNSRIGLGPTRESGGLLPTTPEPPPSGGVPRPVAPITLFTERPVQGTSSPPVSPSSATVVSSSRSPVQHDKVTANGSATQPTTSVHSSASSAPPPAVLRSSPQGGIIPERRSWTAATYMPVHTESPLISELPDAPFPLFRERRAPTLLLQSAQPEPGDMSSIVLPGTAETGVRPVRGMDRPPTPIQSDALRMASGPQQEPVVSPDITSPETVDYGTVPRRLDLSPPTDPMLSTDSAVGMGEVQGEATASPSHYKGVPISHPDIRSQGDLARAFQTPTAQGGFGYNASDARYTASRYDRIAREWAKRTGRQVTDWYTGHIAGIVNGGERLAQILADPQDTTLPHAAVEFLQDGRALVMALSNPKASSAIHELGHITRRVLANEDSEGYVALSTWAGAKRDKRTGRWIWDVRAEEQLAKAIETLEMARRESDAKYSALVTWMPPSIERFLDLFRGLYIGFRSGVDRYTAERNGTLPEGINGEALATLDRWFGTGSERAAQAVGRAVGTARGILTSRGQAGRGQVSQTAQGTMSPTTQTYIARALAGLPLFQGSE